MIGRLNDYTDERAVCPAKQVEFPNSLTSLLWSVIAVGWADVMSINGHIQL